MELGCTVPRMPRFAGSQCKQKGAEESLGSEHALGTSSPGSILASVIASGAVFHVVLVGLAHQSTFPMFIRLI